MSNTAETIKSIAARILRCDASLLEQAASWKDLKADSLDIVQILIATEDTFDIEINDDDLPGLTNFNEFVAYVDKCLAEKEKVS
jgi:acyl carrier protein